MHSICQFSFYGLLYPTPIWDFSLLIFLRSVSPLVAISWMPGWGVPLVRHKTAVGDPAFTACCRGSGVSWAASALLLQQAPLRLGSGHRGRSRALLGRTGACVPANCGRDRAKRWQRQHSKVAWEGAWCQNSAFALSWERPCHSYLKHLRSLTSRALCSSVLELLNVYRAYVYHIMFIM